MQGWAVRAPGAVRRVLSAHGTGSGHLGAIRGVHNGHVRRTLEKLGYPQHRWLKEVDQAPDVSNIRKQKDRYLREMSLARGEISGLFSNDAEARKAVEPSTPEELAKQADSKQRQEDVTEAMRVYKLLRPDAPPFYEEDAMFSMEAKMNKMLVDEAPEDGLVPSKFDKKYGDPFQAYLPVVNQRAFLLALESVVASLADDLETMCEIIGIADLPAEDDPLRFKKLVDILFGAFPLKKDPSFVQEFMDEHWQKLRLLMPESIARLPAEVVSDWLRGHLRRVRLNQRRQKPKIFLHQAQRFGDEEWYSFAEDFPYDDDPMPGVLADERNLDFPLEKAAEYMQALLGFVTESPVAKIQESSSPSEGMDPISDVANQFQDLVWDLEKVGLRNWLRMDIRELERFLPKGAVSELQYDADDRQVARLMLRCASRGRANLLDFEAVDPYKLLHGFPAREIDDELADLPANQHLSDSDLGGLVDAYDRRVRARQSEVTATDASWLGQGAGVQEVFKRELDFYRTAGPAEWFLDPNKNEYTWRWRQPPNTFWDERRKTYIPQQKGVDPSLDLKEMRQHLLEMRRMGSMVKEGRIYYYRAVTIVGNGRGVYGFGVGFANTPKEARADAALKGLQNLDYIDYDPGRMMCFPVRGTEYKQMVKVVPRPLGRGLKANKKFLPLLYILGLDNCKVSFMNTAKWFTRARAIKRALDSMVSRRTLANMTGKRHALLVAPGDHWVHWPDRWFARIREPYDAKADHAKLVRRFMLCNKKRGNTIASPLETRPGWRKENWARWNNPLERWLQYRRKNQPLQHRNDPTTKHGSESGAIPGAGSGLEEKLADEARAIGRGEEPVKQTVEKDKELRDEL